MESKYRMAMGMPNVTVNENLKAVEWVEKQKKKQNRYDNFGKNKF